MALNGDLWFGCCIKTTLILVELLFLLIFTKDDLCHFDSLKELEISNFGLDLHKE